MVAHEHLNEAMSTPQVSPEHVALLAALADGIIPADERDGGAAAVNAGSRLAERIRAGFNTALYEEGIKEAEALARREHGRAAAELTGSQMHQLLGRMQETVPAFFRQLRMDVAAMYLGDSGVWQSIGFPGPSIASGGYPDFDQPQAHRITTLKEDPTMNTGVLPTTGDSGPRLGPGEQTV
jgi:hypothetical protein